MKLSLKFRDQETHPQNPLLRAKIPVAILGVPFLSGVVAGDSSDLAFSLRSNFSAGPTLSLSYHPTLPNPSGTFPFSVALKSGTGVFGSPHESPLVFTARFNLFASANPNPNPSSLNPIFSLTVKPQFGNFSLFKSVSSSSLAPIQVNGHAPNGNLSNGSVQDFETTNGTVGPEKGFVWSDLKRGPSSSSYGEILSGILVAAKTSMPLTKRAMVHFRWGVKLPPEVGSSSKTTQLPVLVMNKVSLERVDEGKKVDDDGKKRSFEEGKSGGEVEVLKGMCGWMRKEVEELQRENRQMKQMLESMKSQSPANSRVRCDDRDAVVKRAHVEGSNEFEKWRSKRGNNGGGNGEENGSRDSKKMSEVESELQKAIKAAAGSS